MDNTHIKLIEIEKIISKFKNNNLQTPLIKYEVNGNTIKMMVDKKEYNYLITNLKNNNIKSTMNLQDRILELEYDLILENNNVDKIFLFVHFVDSVFFQEINTPNKNIKNWTDFFQCIDPEYKNILTRIINDIPISVFRDERGKVMSQKMYWIDINKGLQEKKEKFIKDEYIITYKHITDNIYQIFRMFFRFYDEISIDELTKFDKFKDIISKTKYNRYLYD